MMLSNGMQTLFNAADAAVVGQFAGSESLAAVGSTGALTNLFINLFMGFSSAVRVLVARYYVSRDQKALHETVHTAILFALVGGMFFSVFGMLASPPLLRVMGTPVEVLPKAAVPVSAWEPN